MTQPLIKTFFSPKFGMLADKFGVNWMVLVGQLIAPRAGRTRMPYMLLVMEPAGQREARPCRTARFCRPHGAVRREPEGARDRKILRLARADIEGRAHRDRDGKRHMVDGPFTEAKEIVGGFFMLDCSKEEALAAAAECPAAEYATIEVREVGPCWER